jgi:hypothetical protein
MTLLELMVSVSLLSVIFLGMYSMFDRTQQAMRSGVNQVDSQEPVRAASDILSRDMQQISRSRIPGVTNFYLVQLDIYPGSSPIIPTPLRQFLPGSASLTNFLYECFFLSKDDQWHGIGYIIAPMSSSLGDRTLYTNGVGSLMRFEVRTNANLAAGNRLLDLYNTAVAAEVGGVLNGAPSAGYTNLNRVADGVVRFHLRAYSTNGVYLQYIPATNLPIALVNMDLPRQVDFELGILEPQIVEQARAIPIPAASHTYLLNQAAHVHLARQRVPILTAAP